MTILEFMAGTFSPQLPDGRFVFRPWGARGPCYLLTARQRTRRAAGLLAFYAIALAALWIVPEAVLTWAGALVFVALHYLVYWLFSIGLAMTATPPRSTPDQRRAAVTAHSRALGRPVLWIFLILSWLFILGGVLVIAVSGDWTTGLLSILFFGVCAATFTWQLRLIRAARG